MKSYLSADINGLKAIYVWAEKRPSNIFALRFRDCCQLKMWSTETMAQNTLTEFPMGSQELFTLTNQAAIFIVKECQRP